MVDEVEVVPWSDGHGPGSPLGEGDVGLVQGLVDVDEPIDDGLTIGRGLGKVRGSSLERCTAKIYVIYKILY